MLALVFVNALHLDVEERVGRDRDAGALRDERGEPVFVRELHLAPLLLELSVVRERLQFAEPGEILQPPVADAFRDQLG